MKSKLLFIFSAVLFVFVSLTNAQDNLSISGEIRPRSIFDSGDFNKDTSPFSFTELRTRLGVSFNPNSNLKAFIQFQDSRIFGTEPTTLSSTQNIDLHQGYLEVKNLFSLPFNIKMGRMESNYGNQRLIGAVGWSNIGRSFDGGILTLTTKAVDIDLFSFQTDENLKFADSLDSFFSGLWADLKLSPTYQINIFLLNERIWKSEMLDRYTAGFYTKGNLGDFAHELEFSYQLGNIQPADKKLDVNAFMFAYNAKYTFNEKVKPSISAGIDFLSGDKNLSDNKYEVFNTLYATNHKFYGYMDYFINLPLHTYGLGLMDIHGKIEIKPLDKLSLAVNLHLFNSNQDYMLKNNSSSRNFGTEIDFIANYNYDDNLTFQGGLSTFLPGDIFKETKGEDNSYWGYLMAMVNL